MRGVPRWVAVLAVVAIAAVVCAFTVRRAHGARNFILQLSPTEIPADGFTSTELRISPSNGRHCAACRSRWKIRIARRWKR